MYQNLIILVFISIVGSGLSQTGRIINGQPLDDFSRFPHHVTIQSSSPAAVNSTTPKGRSCSGSIIHSQWILTSASCVNNSTNNLEIQFKRLYKSSSIGSFSVIVGVDAVSIYPTNSDIDDIALIHLPIILPYGNDLKPVQLANEENFNGIGLMPGFSDEKITYGLFEPVSGTSCGSFFGSSNFDNYYHICVRGYANGLYIPIEGNEGAGLIIGAPRQPHLIGILSKTTTTRNRNSPSIFIKVAKYLPWIQYITSYAVKVY